MDNLQYLHNTLLEYNMLDKSFEEFKLASSDKSYQQKVYQETSNRGMFAGSFVDFQNKYFPTQAATVTPTSTLVSTKTKPKTKTKVITTEEKSEETLKIEQDAVNKEFWKNAGWKHSETGEWVSVSREDYFKEDGEWYYKNPTTGKVSKKLHKGSRYEELLLEENRVKNNILKLESAKAIKVYRKENQMPEMYDPKYWDGIIIPGKPTTDTEPKINQALSIAGQVVYDKGKPMEYDEKLGTFDMKKFSEDTTAFHKGFKKVQYLPLQGIVDEKVFKIQRKVKSTQSKYQEQIISLKTELAEHDPKSDEYKDIQKKLKKLIGEEKEELNNIDLEDRRERGKKEFHAVDTDITDMDDDYAIDELYAQYGKYGFKFYIDRTSGDEVRVTSYDGEVEWFDVDAFWGNWRGGDTRNAKALTEWMRPRAVWHESTVEAFHERNILTEEERKIKNEEGKKSLENNIKQANFKNWIEDNRADLLADLPPQRDGLDEKNPPQEHIDAANEYWDGDIDAMYDFLYSAKLKRVRQAGNVTVPGGEEIGDGYLILLVDTPGWEETVRGQPTAYFYEGGEKYDVSRKDEIDQAIRNVAFNKWRKDKNSNLSNADIYKKHRDTFDVIEGNIRSEWEELITEDEDGLDWEAIKNHEVYKKAGVYTEDAFIKEEMKQRISDEIEGMGGEAFSKSEAQKLLYEQTEKEYKELSEEAKYLMNSSEVINKEFDKIKGDGETFGLEYEAKWLEKNQVSIFKRIAEIRNKKHTSQESVDRANAEITGLIEEFDSHYKKYESLRKNSTNMYETAMSLQMQAEEVLIKEDEFALIVDVLGRNHQVGTQSAVALASRTIELLQGIATATEAVAYYINPFGRLGDLLLDSGAIENEVLKSFITIGQHITPGGLGTRFDDDPETTSLSQIIHRKIDAGQEYLNSTVQEPPKFSDIDSFSDFGEWASVMFSGQAPQLALMIASGGQSAWIQGGLMAGSAGGQKFLGMEEQRELFLKTRGLYGKDFGIDQMFFSSTAVGIAEALSEQITFGQIKGVSKFLKTNPAAKEGFISSLRKTMFAPENMKKFGVDLLREGGSEVAATMSENLVDIINGEDVGIFDNIAESFVSGVMISGAIKSPILFHHMTQPFITPDNKALIDNNQRRVDQLLEIISMGKPTNKSVKEWEVMEKKYTEEIELLYEDSKTAMEIDIKRVDMLDDSEIKELVDIHSENKRLEREVAENNNNPDLTEIERAERYNELNNQWRNNNQVKAEILGKYKPNVVNSKYDNMMESVINRAKEFTLETDLQVNIEDGSSVDMTEWMSNQDGYRVVKNEKTGAIEQIVIDENTRKGLINQYKNLLTDPDLSKKNKKQYQKRLDLLEAGENFSATPDVIKGIVGNSSNYGSMIPKFDSKGNLTGYNMFVNKSTSYDSGKFNTAAHEFLHGVLYQTLQQDAGTQKALTETVLNTLNKKGVVVSDAIMETINLYAQEGARAEEIMTVVSEAYIDGDIKIPKSGILGMKDFFRRWSQNKVNGKDIAFDTDEDVINFIKDYSYSMKNNKQNRALTRMMASGVSGKLIAKAQEHRDEIKKNTPTKGEAMFSRNVEQELNNNPDLLTEIDAFVKNEDGTSKYTDKSIWQTSTDFVDAWSLITQSKKLDGLIQAGMVGEGINTAQALGEFTRKVKDELGERLLMNFNPAKNDSLFGWLTGVSGGAGKSIIYRAKGDVMVEYSKQLKTVSIDKGITTTEGDTFSSQLEGEIDPEIERLETEDLTIGKVTVKKSDVDVVFLESVNANKTIIKSIDNIVENSGVNLEGLTYNGTKKNLVKHDGGKPKSKRKPVGPLYKVLDIISNQFGVDGMRIIKEQDLTTTQRNLAREYINEHAQKLIDMLPEGENKSGDATGVANTVLGEFYIKGERISMAEAGTGKGKISQTKRDDISVNEFVEFFNKPGTKSDGAIRALITQAATISANQAIRLNAISKQLDPISTIALVGDGKSAMMFSKAPSVKNNEFIKHGKFIIDTSTKEGQKIINQIKSIPTVSSSEFKRAGKWKIDTTTKEGRDIVKQLDEIPTVSSSEFKKVGNWILDTTTPEGKKIQDQLESIPTVSSKIQFSKNFQDIGSIDRNLSPEAKDNFWTNINVFASENILDRNLDSIKIALENAYVPFPEILENVDQIAKSIHNVVKQVKDPIIKNPVKLSGKLLTSNENALVKVKESSGSDIDATAAFKDPKKVKNYVATTTVLANQMFDPNNLGLSIARIYSLKDHLASMGKNYLGRKQIFPGTKEFLANTLGKIPGIGPDGYTIKVAKDGKISLDTVTYNNQEIVMPSILSSQSSGTALNDTKSEIKMEKRDANEDMAQETLNDIVTYYSDLFKRGEIDNVDLMMVKASLLSGMNSVLARAAKLKYISENVNSFKDPGKQLRYEHMLPRVAVIINMFNAHINGDGISNIKEHLKNYTVQIIPVTMDKAISDAKLGSSLLGNQTFQDPSWIRNYNSRTQGDKRLVAIKDITTGEVIIPSKAFVLTNEILLKNRKANIAFSKAVNQANITNENTPSRGMSAFDFDETVGISDNFVIARKDGKTKKIASNEWPFVGETMKNEGWEMDFTDFNIVTKGRPGPLMEKLRNRIKKFGPENNYIVTARAPESEVNIHAYLKSENINIPLENITGLGNSTGAAKALWITEKFAEGYNDIYFVDDALPNVEAVKNVMDQLDIKGKAVQAKIQFSKRINPEFNNILDGNIQTELDLNRILEQTKGVKAESRFSDAQAKVRGSKKGKWKFWVPPSAEDFKGLIYRFLAKGRIGEQQMAFFKKALFDPFNRANAVINTSKQRLENEYRGLLKQFPDVKKSLNKTVGNTNFTTAQAVRVYLWNKAGFEIPGLSQRDLNALVQAVEGDVDILAFANSLGIISNQEAGYTQPGEYWTVENIQSDINTINNEISRADHLAEWKQNIETMFGTWENGRLVGPNMNKIEAIYGTKFREALEDIVWRMEFGTKRQKGSNRLVNAFNNWANQSVGAIMFLNMRSALLQTISSINYLNWSDNNPLKAGLALANFPQFIKDFTMIFNSDMLKQRRGGQQRGINEAELAEAVAGSKNTPKAMLHWLLTKGFLPTQIADSFAIASGGATFFRNRVNSLLKQGMTQEQAESKAWEDFQENTEESQQSARPDMISQQQASPLGRYILAFKNTPMQYARLMKKSWLDLINGRGDAKTNMGKIIYYGMVQNLIFSALQTSLGAMIGDDDEEKDAKAHERTINSMIDSILGGLGFGGNAVVTIKNMIMEYNKQENKGWNADHTYTILKFFSFSPTLGSKGRKLYSAIQTRKFNEDVMKEMDLLDIDNPTWSVIANIVSAITNIPLDRLVKKIDNLDAAITEDITTMQRFALLMGWNTWDLDIDDSDVLAVEDEIKKDKEIEKKKKKKIKKEEKKKEKEEEEVAIEQSFIEDQKQERKEGKKDITCVAVNKSGDRCKTKVEGDNTYCTIHQKVEIRTDGKKTQCKKIKSDGNRCGMKTSATSGYCYYHD